MRRRRWRPWPPRRTGRRARLRSRPGRAGERAPPRGRRRVRRLWAAEAALAQAELLVDAVDRRAVELAGRRGGCRGALAEAEADLAEAAKVLEDLAEGLPGAAAEGVTKADLRGRTARVGVGHRGRAPPGGGGPRYDPVERCAGCRRRTRHWAPRSRPYGARRGGAAGRGPSWSTPCCRPRSAVGAADVYVAAHRTLVRSPRPAPGWPRRGGAWDEASGGGKARRPWPRRRTAWPARRRPSPNRTCGSTALPRRAGPPGAGTRAADQGRAGCGARQGPGAGRGPARPGGRGGCGAAGRGLPATGARAPGAGRAGPRCRGGRGAAARLLSEQVQQLVHRQLGGAPPSPDGSRAARTTPSSRAVCAGSPSPR